MAQIRVDIRFIGRGWMVVTVGTNGLSDDGVPLAASYILDSVTLLADRTLALLRGSDRTVIPFEEEPGEYRMICTRRNDQVRVNIRYFPDTHSGKRDEDGELVLSMDTPLLRFAAQITGQLQQLLNEHKPEGYKERWGHDFPMIRFRQLQEQILRSKRGSC